MVDETVTSLLQFFKEDILLSFTWLCSECMPDIFFCYFDKVQFLNKVC